MNKEKNMPEYFISKGIKWDEIYEKKDFSLPATVLVKNSFLLPKEGKALDLACGLGENALFLAERGLDVQAWDISSVALKRLKEKATRQQLNIAFNHTFINTDSFPKNAFDVVIVSRFLDRSLSNAIIESLTSGGLLFYQTYVKEKFTTEGPNNPDFLLDRNELLNIFQVLKVVVYRENSMIGDLMCGERSEAYFVGQKK